MHRIAFSFPVPAAMLHFRPIQSFFLSLLSPRSSTLPAPAHAGQHDHSLTQDAFSIADQSMIATLRAECIRQDAEGLRLWPVDASGMKVQAVAQACPQILRALEWCRKRGMVQIETNAWDELIVLNAPAA